ncbi:HAD-like domain-containing protein [Dunaliella salina]|uniref:HAD-like domain-containing protein n=1 Tax=Dunaliella salina TaxID=3046 RepID=A0ABQ7GPZ5_DUNSA|nr:HAD-like domain-containing protein [Dunaliella salina]|eukprot:KAF5836684.1 HAD-like domain-containing protein [Dunaliella salina]
MYCLFPRFACAAFAAGSWLALPVSRDCFCTAFATGLWLALLAVAYRTGCLLASLLVVHHLHCLCSRVLACTASFQGLLALLLQQDLGMHCLFPGIAFPCSALATGFGLALLVAAHRTGCSLFACIASCNPLFALWVVSPFRSYLLPRKTRQCRQKTIVLDLDETLVHSSLETPAEASDFSFPVFFNNQEHMINVRCRPHLQSFMQRVAELFEVVVFTASQKIYAELINTHTHTDACVVVEGNYLKDLSVLGRDLKDTFIIDNSPQAFGFQVDNGIPIESWYSDDGDEELLRMLPFLEALAEAEDVRPAISARFRLRELIDGAPSS